MSMFNLIVKYTLSKINIHVLVLWPGFKIDKKGFLFLA